MSNPNQPPAGPVTTRPPASPLDTIKANILKPSFLESLKAVLPQHMTGERQARVLCAIMNKTPKLASCTWASLAQCMIDCSSMGLEPDGRRAHLIPYGTTCTLIVDYKGLVELIYRSGAVDFIDAYCVYANELAHDEALGRPRFDVEYGGQPNIFHKPILDGTKRGEFVGAYCVAHIKGITKPKFVWMLKSEIDAIRKRSKAANNGPWVNDYEEMAKKTTIRRISKTLPMSYEMNELLTKEVQHEHGAIDVDTIVGGRFTAAKPPTPRALPPGQTGAESMVGAVRELQDPPPPPAEEAGGGGEAGATEEQPAGGEGGTGGDEERAEAELGLAPAPPAPAPAPAKAAAPAKAPAAAPAKAPAAPSSPIPAPATEEKIVALEQWCLANDIEEGKLCAWAAGKFRVSAVDTVREMSDFAPRKVATIIDNIDVILPNETTTYSDQIKAYAGGAA